MDKEKPLKISNLTLSSRFFLGSSGYSSPFELTLAIKQSEASLITMGVKRLGIESLNNSEGWLKEISGCGVPILPNTAGCRNARDAITVAEIARELFNTNLIKLEVVGDDFSLQPNPFELVEAAKVLAKNNFSVLPFCTADLVVGEALIDAGCDALMPWGSPIGSGQGLLNIESLKRFREKFSDIVLVIDAGIGKPSDACIAMELGYDAVLLNSAVSQAKNPVDMAIAFSQAISAGRNGFRSGLITPQSLATPTTDISNNIF